VCEVVLRYLADFGVKFYIMAIFCVLRNEVAVDAHTACEVDMSEGLVAHKLFDEFGFIARCEFA
jgi:hypothetical protein